MNFLHFLLTKLAACRSELRLVHSFGSMPNALHHKTLPSSAQWVSLLLSVAPHGSVDFIDYTSRLCFAPLRAADKEFVPTTWTKVLSAAHWLHQKVIYYYTRKHRRQVYVSVVFCINCRTTSKRKQQREQWKCRNSSEIFIVVVVGSAPTVHQIQMLSRSNLFSCASIWCHHFSAR